MSEIVNVKTDGALKISVESKLLESTQKAHAWYTSKKFSVLALLALIVIDVAGFLQITNLTLEESPMAKLLIVSAFAVAFEIAPTYIGYALDLKCYKLGKAIHNWILVFSITACILGIIANTVFRILTMNLAYVNAVTGETSEVALPLTIVMCVLPVITSLINLVIGCLSFDPLLFDKLRLTKKVRLMEERKRQIEAYIEELDTDDNVMEALLQDEKNYYDNIKKEIDAVKGRLYNYVKVRTTSTI